MGTSSQPRIHPKLKVTWKKALMALIVIVVLIGVGWFLLPSSLKWTVYRNEKYGFEFSHPRGSRIDVDGYWLNLHKQTPRKKLYSTTFYTDSISKPGNYSINFTVEANPSNLMPSEYIRENLDDNFSIKSQESITIGGRSGSYASVETDENETEDWFAALLKDGQILTATAHYGVSQELRGTHLPTIKDIISSVKFLD